MIILLMRRRRAIRLRASAGYPRYSLAAIARTWSRPRYGDRSLHPVPVVRCPGLEDMAEVLARWAAGAGPADLEPPASTHATLEIIQTMLELEGAQWRDWRGHSAYAGQAEAALRLGYGWARAYLVGLFDAGSRRRLDAHADTLLDGERPTTTRRATR
jgi:hypothetical protein